VGERGVRLIRHALLIDSTRSAIIFRAMLTLELMTDDGPIVIREDDLADITGAELRIFRISRQKLEYLFDEGDELMCSVHPSERVRLCAAEKNGNWVVRLVRHCELTEPLMAGRA
jgi:hypothetical protein